MGTALKHGIPLCLGFRGLGFRVGHGISLGPNFSIFLMMYGIQKDALIQNLQAVPL